MTGNFVSTMCVLLAAAILCGMAKAPAPVPAEPETVMQLTRDNTDFALRLYNRLAAEEGNLFLSPHSISTALAMTWAGARGDTAREMATALGFTLDQKRLHPAFAGLEAELERARRESGVTLATANALWPQQGFDFARQFLDMVEANYDAELRTLDFVRETEKARLTINGWVEEQTADRIKDLIQPGVLGPATRLVLTNAIYFKGLWKHPFKEKLTRDQSFTLAGGHRVDVPMMRIREDFGYGEADGLQLLRLPYGEGGLAMVILLPEAGGLSALEAKLDHARLGEWLAGLMIEEVDVHLPRFRFTMEFQLNAALTALGMKTAFGERADFSGMSKEPLFLSAVIHKAFVEVNEEGTEAAAATAGVVAMTAMPRPPKVFRADRPFIFMILGGGDEILFMGRTADPR